MTRSPLLLAGLALTLALAGCGNRSVGNKIDDQFIAPEVSSNVARAHTDLTSPTSHIVVTSYNGVVLLAGQTPRNDLKGMAEQAARKVNNVARCTTSCRCCNPPHFWSAVTTHC